MAKNSCYQAEYINTIDETTGDELAPSQVLSSSNCEFILIRTPPSIVSFYSVSDETIIKKWTLNNNENAKIWSIYSSNTKTQKITITNEGCLNWISTENDIILDFICTNQYNNYTPNNQYTNTKTLSVPTVMNNQNQSINTDIYSHSNLMIFIPMLICMFGIFIIACYCLNKKCFHLKDAKNNININDEEEDIIGTNNTKTYKVFDVIDDLQINWEYIENMETDDSSSISDCLDIDHEENRFVFDPRALKMVSQDNYVSNHILTPISR